MKGFQTRAALGIVVWCMATSAPGLPVNWEWIGADDPKATPPKTTMRALARSAVDRPDSSTQPQVHLMYVLPSDGPDEQLDTNGRIGTSAGAWNGWLSQQTGGRRLRIDAFEGLPDIGFHRMSRTDAQLRATGAFIRDEIERELRAAGLVREHKVYAVYYGGSSSVSCGAGAWPPALVGNVAAMYLKGEPPGAPPCVTNVLGSSLETPGYLEFGMLHEIFHTLGFVAACAPHHHLAGHVSDSRNDLMWAGNDFWQLPPRLDIGRDDYYGHGRGGCADFMASRFLAPGDSEPNFTDLWWDPAEPGWGLNLNHQSDLLFATLFTYAADGRGMWFFASSLPRLDDGVFNGVLYRATGPPFDAQRWGPINVVEVGTMSITFAGPGRAVLRYSVGQSQVTKSIERQRFDVAPVCGFTAGSRAASVNYQDLWWQPREPGWGLNLSHQGDVIFATLFHYGADAAPSWLVASALRRAPGGGFEGALYRATGSGFDSRWSPSVLEEVGNMRLTFSSGEAGTLTYSVLGATVIKSIERQVFASRPTLCITLSAD